MIQTQLAGAAGRILRRDTRRDTWLADLQKFAFTVDGAPSKVGLVATNVSQSNETTPNGYWQMAVANAVAICENEERNAVTNVSKKENKNAGNSNCVYLSVMAARFACAAGNQGYSS